MGRLTKGVRSVVDPFACSCDPYPPFTALIWGFVPRLTVTWYTVFDWYLLEACSFLKRWVWEAQYRDWGEVAGGSGCRGACSFHMMYKRKITFKKIMERTWKLHLYWRTSVYKAVYLIITLKIMHVFYLHYKSINTRLSIKSIVSFLKEIIISYDKEKNWTIQ